MKSNSEAGTALASTLTDATFREHHSSVIDADIDTTWHAVHTITWSDLHLTRALLRIRNGSARAGDPGRSCLESLSSHAVTYAQPCTETMFALVGKPWSPRPQFVELTTLDDVRAFNEPGWLKYGMEWRLTALPGNRTFIETRTLCTPTDATTHRIFTAYWYAIRIGSGLIRHDMIAAIRRNCQTVTLR